MGRKTVLAIAVLLFSCAGDTEIPTNTAPLSQPQPTVTPLTEAPQHTGVENPHLVDEGYTAAVVSEGAQIISAVGDGRVESMLVRVGQKIKVGQELVRLDLSSLQSQLDVALAAQSSAQAARSKAAIEVSEAGRQVTLSRRLYRDQVRSKESVNQASFGLQRARANLREFGGIVKQREAQIQELKKTISQLGMRASISGVVANLYSQVGQSVQRGQKLLRVIDPSQLAVRFAIPDSELSKVSTGSKAEMIVDGRILSLVVVSVSPDIDPGLRLAFALAKPESKTALKGISPGTVGKVLISRKQ